jgi:hypothetical protein
MESDDTSKPIIEHHAPAFLAPEGEGSAPKQSSVMEEIPFIGKMNLQVDPAASLSIGYDLHVGDVNTGDPTISLRASLEGEGFVRIAEHGQTLLNSNQF